MTVFVNRKMFVFPSDNNESTSNSQMLIKSSKAKSPGKCSKEKTNPIKHEIIRQLNSSNETTVSERIHDNAPSSAEMLRHLDEHLKSRKNLQTEKTGTKEMKNPNNMFNQVMVTKVKKEAFKAWHIQWRETHYSACSALKKHLKKYALEPDWNQMSFNDISQINAFDRYLNTLKFRMEPPQTSLLIKIFKNEKDIVEQIKSGNQDVIDDMREQYWFFYKERLTMRWYEIYSKKSEHIKSAKSEIRRYLMNKENNNAYSKLKFLFSSRDILNQHWESDNQNNSNHWKNERFDLCAIGDSEFSDVQCQEFNTHYFSEDFMILTPCHSMISQPDEAIRAMLDTGIIDIPEKLQFKNACDPVAITSLNGENNRTFLNYLALMSDKINYFVVTCYWKTECDKRQSYGFMPAYILTRNPNAKDAISSEEFHKFENSLSQIFHLTCNCSHSAAASFIQMHTQTGDMPVPYDNIADTLDLFFRMQLSDPKTENSTELLSVRYLSPESPDEFSKNRRITRGEIFWQTTAKEKVA